jgi:hypothetical protein
MFMLKRKRSFSKLENVSPNSAPSTPVRSIRVADTECTPAKIGHKNRKVLLVKHTITPANLFLDFAAAPLQSSILATDVPVTSNTTVKKAPSNGHVPLIATIISFVEPLAGNASPNIVPSTPVHSIRTAATECTPAKIGYNNRQIPSVNHTLTPVNIFADFEAEPLQAKVSASAALVTPDVSVEKASRRRSTPFISAIKSLVKPLTENRMSSSSSKYSLNNICGIKLLGELEPAADFHSSESLFPCEKNYNYSGNSSSSSSSGVSDCRLVEQLDI